MKKISVVAGVATWVALTILGVPYAGVIGLFVAFTDLIPLIGATLGAIPSVIVAFLHSVPAGIIVLAVFILYQQFENHVLQVTIMSRTVQLNPLLVLVSVLVGVELFGFVGALLAIPAAGVIQVIVKDVYAFRHPPLSAVEAREIAEQVEAVTGDDRAMDQDLTVDNDIAVDQGVDHDIAVDQGVDHDIALDQGVDHDIAVDQGVDHDLALDQGLDELGEQDRDGATEP